MQRLQEIVKHTNKLLKKNSAGFSLALGTWKHLHASGACIIEHASVLLLILRAGNGLLSEKDQTGCFTPAPIQSFAMIF